MKRLGLVLVMLLGWSVMVAAGSAQSGGGDGWPPQTALFRDANLLARATPFLIGLAIVVGIVQARQAARSGGDAILGDQVRRHDTGTIVAHWMNAAGFFICLVTGAFALRWVAPKAELRTTFALHYLGAALILFAVFNHLARHGVSGGTGLIPKRLSVIRDVIGELLEYAGLFGPEDAALKIPWPKAIRQPIARYVRALLGYKPGVNDKFLPTEQVLSYLPWAIWITLIIVTGLIKVLRYMYPLPSTLVASATATHDVVAIIIGVSIIIHLLPLLLVPANWPLLMSIFKTTVPRKYAERRHPLWLKRLHSSKALAEAPQPASSEPLPASTASAPSAD